MVAARYFPQTPLYYAAYYDRTFQLICPDGLMAFDNVLWLGRVAEPSNHDEITQTKRVFNQKLANDDRFVLSLLPITDESTLALKK